MSGMLECYKRPLGRGQLKRHLRSLNNCLRPEEWPRALETSQTFDEIAVFRIVRTEILALT